MNGRRSLGWRLGAWMFAATVCVAVPLTLYYQRQTHALLERESEERLATLARHVAATSLLGTLAYSEELLAGPLDGAMSHPDVEAVTIHDADGNRIAARSRAGGAAPPWRERAAACRPCDLGGDRLLWVEPIAGAARDKAGLYDGPPPPASSAVAGWLMLQVTTAPRALAERQLTLSGLLISAVALLLALVITPFIARRLTSPLRELAQASREIGKGHWDAPLPRAASSEIAQLADDFRAMTAALAELDRENRRYREHLEEIVANRTRELEDAYHRMKSMAEAKDQFVATVSHDFRSPLAIILSAVQTILADPGMREDVRRQFLGRAERQCKRLGALVNDLLDLARIENRDAILEKVSLSDVIEETLDGVRAAFEERRVALSYAAPRERVIAEVDRGHFGRALSNLVDNALKFTPPSGSVTVELSRADDEALISVRDTGPGIPDEEREHVFERFFQGRQGQALGSGSGLGLAIVAGVARRHGGSVALASAGEGSTFELRLPISA